MGAVYRGFGGLALVVATGCSFSGTGLTVDVASVGTEETGASTEGTDGAASTTGDPPTTSNASVDPDTTNGPTQPPTTEPETTDTPDDTTAQASATSGTDTGESTKGETGETSQGETSKGETGETGETSKGESSTGECDPLAFYPDNDGDGYGVKEGVVMACAPPDGYVEVPGDCDDEDEEVSPDAVELCDNADNDCDLLVDEYSAMNTMCGGCKIVPDDVNTPTKAYYFCNSNPLKNWDAAKGLCEDRMAMLVADETDQEHTFLTAQITLIDAMSGGWWTGGWAPGVLGYKWLNNVAINGGDGRWDFVQVASDPNKCVQLLSSGVNNGNKWTARSCNEAKPYICEQDLTP